MTLEKLSQLERQKNELQKITDMEESNSKYLESQLVNLFRLSKNKKKSINF